MASEFYVAEDGSIHRHPVSAALNAGNRTNVQATTAMRSQTRAESRPVHQVSEIRKVWFWIISIITSILIALGINQGFGSMIFEDESEILATIGPYIIFFGSLAGSILYGIFSAKLINYNLWAYILSALSSVCGIIVTGIAAMLISFMLMILFYGVIIVVAIAVIVGLAGGS